MKFSTAAAASAVLTSFGNEGAHAFVGPSPSLSSDLRLSATPDDPYGSVVEAISQAADAANAAAAASASLASSLRVPDIDIGGINLPDMPDMSGIHVDDATLVSSLSSVMTPEAISAAQAKLALLESNVATSTDPAVVTKSIADALDASVAVAEHAASSASVLTANLADLDAALSNSMALYHANHDAFHFLPPETAEVAQAKLALLVHNLSGATLDDAFVTNFLADLDRRLDALGLGVGDVSGSAVVMYGTVALALAYSQREAGVRGYKKELKHMLEGGELDIDVLAKDVGMQPAAEAAALAMASVEDAEAPLEDPTIAMAAMADEIETPLEDPAVAMAAMADEPIETTPKRTRAAAAPRPPADPVVVAAPGPPAEDVSMETLVRAAAAAAVVPTPPPAGPEVVVEFSTRAGESPAVGVRRGTAGKKPAASPLARLLANELGLDLRDLGEGSGKGGKILIDDVREFQAGMEDAKNSVVKNVASAFFATASA